MAVCVTYLALKGKRARHQGEERLRFQGRTDPDAKKGMSYVLLKEGVIYI